MKNLNGFPVEVRDSTILTWNPDLPLLRTLVSGLRISLRQTPNATGEQIMDVYRVESILNDPHWRRKGKVGAIPCAAALIKAGFPGNAKW